MKLFLQLSLALSIALFNTGCNGKSFTLQSYADEYFNDKESNEDSQTTKSDKTSTETAESAKIKEETKTDAPSNNKSVSGSNIDEASANAAIKSGPGADIAWSSTYKKDKETQGEGVIQKSLDNWLEKEWEPTFEGDTNQTNKDKEAKEHFNLQHYVDKAGKYMDKKEAEKEGQPQEPAHYEKMEELPVIGK